MQILLSLAVTAALIALCRKPLKNHPWVFYGAAAVLACAAAFLPLTMLPLWSRTYVLDLFRKGYLGTAVFIVVMVTGALKNGSPLMKTLMPLRGELSILGGVLILGHTAACLTALLNISEGGQTLLWGLQWVNIALCFLMLALLLPLWVTSFPAVRRKMGAQRWKRLQRLAYLFYLVTYVHLMVVEASHMLEGKSGCLLPMAVYTFVFLTYGAMRIRKAMGGKAKWFPAAAALVLAAAVLLPAWSYAGTGGRNGAFAAGSGQEETAAVAAAVNSPYSDGVWQGEAMGYNGPICASVTVSGGVITDIVIVSQSDDEPYYSEAEAAVLPAMLEAQSTWVDAVTGATTTSWGIMDAVQAALDAAAK